MLFFHASKKTILQAYIDACLYGLGNFFYWRIRSWNCNRINQTSAFWALMDGKRLLFNLKLPKDPNDTSIRACSSLLDFTLRGPANASLWEIFLIAAEWDIVIEPEGKLNGLADAFSRFDNGKIADLCSHWQNAFNSMIRRHPSPLSKVTNTPCLD